MKGAMIVATAVIAAAMIFSEGTWAQGIPARPQRGTTATQGATATQGTAAKKYKGTVKPVKKKAKKAKSKAKSKARTSAR